jgi:hypothetical protein
MTIKKSWQTSYLHVKLFYILCDIAQQDDLQKPSEKNNIVVKQYFHIMYDKAKR